MHYIVKPLPLFFSVCECVLFGPREREKEEVSELYVVLMKYTFLCVCVCVSSVL